jgi:hypothetical protein
MNENEGTPFKARVNLNFSPGGVYYTHEQLLMDAEIEMDPEFKNRAFREGSEVILDNSTYIVTKVRCDLFEVESRPSSKKGFPGNEPPLPYNTEINVFLKKKY